MDETPVDSPMQTAEDVGTDARDAAQQERDLEEEEEAAAAAAAAEEEDEEEDEDDAGADEDDEESIAQVPASRRRATTLGKRVLDDAMSGNEDDTAPQTPNTGSATREGTPVNKPRRRGRPPTLRKADRISPNVVPQDALQYPLDNHNDEMVLSHHDVDGEQKVDENGYLFDGREYRVRTFTIQGRGQRLYMLSTEPARCNGYRDSYLFFIRHKTLFKIQLDEQEKEDLYQRALIPASYRSRQIGVCTARSVFREFGARIIIGGRRIIDDYWVAEYRKHGYKEGELADPDDRLPPPGYEYNRNQYVAWHGASSVYHQAPLPSRYSTRENGMVTRKQRTAAINDNNWILEHAQAASRYNTDLVNVRSTTWQGVYEPHTSQTFYPAITQTPRIRWDAVQNASTQTKSGQVSVEEQMLLRPNMAGGGVHLLDVEQDVLDVLPDDIKAAVQAQRQAEQAEHDRFAQSTAHCKAQLMI
jgi:chromatin structure-remodeling complex protein RSC7